MKTCGECKRFCWRKTCYLTPAEEAQDEAEGPGFRTGCCRTRETRKSSDPACDKVKPKEEAG